MLTLVKCSGELQGTPDISRQKDYHYYYSWPVLLPLPVWMANEFAILPCWVMNPAYLWYYLYCMLSYLDLHLAVSMFGFGYVWAESYRQRPDICQSSTRGSEPRLNYGLDTQIEGKE